MTPEARYVGVAPQQYHSLLDSQPAGPQPSEILSGSQIQVADRITADPSSGPPRSTESDP